MCGAILPLLQYMRGGKKQRTKERKEGREQGENN
jgi:hypothetical protein